MVITLTTLQNRLKKPWSSHPWTWKDELEAELYKVSDYLRESLNVITLVNSIKNSHSILLTHLEGTVCGPLQVPKVSFMLVYAEVKM